jgi:hypothetical protein
MASPVTESFISSTGCVGPLDELQMLIPSAEGHAPPALHAQAAETERRHEQPMLRSSGEDSSR